MTTSADDLICVTSYFNPAKYESRRANYFAFRASLDVPLVTIECAFGDSAFELPETPTTIRVRSRDVMWQKERLLNLAVSRLPAHINKVAWIDADIVFENRAWARDASQLLESNEIVQLFEHATRLAPHDTEQLGTRGFVATCAGTAPPLDPLYCFHGDPGFAWAARREFFVRGGLYDACVAGGADHMIAHALLGWHTSPCITRNLHGAHRIHFTAWAEAVWKRVAGSVTFVPGLILHRWHGRRANRKYSDRHEVLASFGFDPHAHVALNADGCWEWNGAPNEMRDWLVRYFAERREDEV